MFVGLLGYLVPRKCNNLYCRRFTEYCRHDALQALELVDHRTMICYSADDGFAPEESALALEVKMPKATVFDFDGGKQPAAVVLSYFHVVQLTFLQY